ncbi:MAG: M20/M25/M40 family metallo-hydrolase [Bacteroidota bacterium]
MRLQIFLCIFLCCTLGGMAQVVTPKKTVPTVEYDFSKSTLLAHVKELASDTYEGRETGSKGAEKARNYIIAAFEKLGIPPLGTMYNQPFPMPKKSNIAQGENVIAHIKGTEQLNEYIVLSAHYDHLGIVDGKIHNGADDDASGIAALFAFAEYFKQHPPKHSVIFAAFDAEEKGLIGAQFFVENPMVAQEQLKLNINLDMISRSEKKELFAVGPQHFEQLKPIIENTKISGMVNLKIGHKEWTYMGDHANFFRAKIPFVYFGVEDHKDYHKHTDDFENIHPEFYVNAVQTIINFFKKVDQKKL